MQEIWKDIKGYEGLYQISNFGNVKTLEHYSINSKGNKYFVKERILKIHKYPNGYLDVMLQHKGEKHRRTIHRLVAEAFIPNPENLPEINHKDENKGNNYVDNLEWCTRKYNCNYGGCIERQRAANKGRHLTQEQRQKISAALKGKPSHKKGVALSDVTKQKLSEALKGKKPNEKTKKLMSEARKKYWERKKNNNEF